MSRRNCLLAPLAALALLAGGSAPADAQTITVPLQFKNYSGVTLFNVKLFVESYTPGLSDNYTVTCPFGSLRPNRTLAALNPLVVDLSKVTRVAIDADYYDGLGNKCRMTTNFIPYKFYPVDNGVFFTANITTNMNSLLDVPLLNLYSNATCHLGIPMSCFRREW